MVIVLQYTSACNHHTAHLRLTHVMCQYKPTLECQWHPMYKSLTHMTVMKLQASCLLWGSSVLTGSVPGFVSTGIEAAGPHGRAPQNLEFSPQCFAWRGLKNDSQATHYHHLWLEVLVRLQRTCRNLITQRQEDRGGKAVSTRDRRSCGNHYVGRPHSDYMHTLWGCRRPK